MQHLHESLSHTTSTSEAPALRRRAGGLSLLACIVACLLVACGGGGGGADAAASAASTTALAATGSAASATALAELGRRIFQDPNLSEPRGTPCQACHQAQQGFAGNHGSRIGVALGSTPGALGLRNAMTNAYGGFVPAFSFQTDSTGTEARGGHFWDGRADGLAQQALGPLLNPLEMNNPSKQAVVNKIAASGYAALFQQAFGNAVFQNADNAFTQIGVAIEAFERSTALQAFSSKYDAMVRGRAAFTPTEARGMALFQDPGKGNCAACHLMNPTSGNLQDSLFSEFTYYATGIPRNAAIPRNADPAFYDLGLCGPERTPPTLPANLAGTLSIDSFCGKFRMPTLRNVALRNAFMHNGAFNDLAQVLRFYSTRNSDPVRWYGAGGIPNDLPARYLGNIESAKAPFNRSAGAGPALSDAEIGDLLAFLNTLNDGFVSP